MPDPHVLRVMLAGAGFDPPDAQIAFLGDGCDHDNYLVDRQWVLRLPKTPEHEARLEGEVALLSRLEAKTVRVPRPTGPFASAAWPRRYSVYHSRARFFALTAALHSIALGRQMHKPGWVRSGEVALSHAGISVPQSPRPRNS